TSVERQLKENREFIEFMNVCITNFGEKQKNVFFDIYEMHFNADVSFLQADYRRAFRDIYQSQKKQIDLFSEILTAVYLEDSKTILDRIAPGVIKSKNSAARLYLTLAYRDRATARSMQTMGDAVNPRLYSEKISRYIEAVKLSRRSIRFGYLALFESRNIEMKKYIYNHLLEIEREKGNIFYTRFLSKADDGFVKELSRSFDDYEQEYKKNTASAPDPAAAAESNAKPAAAQPAFEKKVEREVRFRQERRVAEYIRDAEFDKAEDIMMKYVEDFNFKLIQATIEAVSAREKDSISLDWASLRIHHADNFSRLSKESVLDSFASNLRVRDDIKKPGHTALPQNQDGASSAAPAPAVSGQDAVKTEPSAAPAK
ncbi:MAG: hypothetical protein ACRCUT_02215, partial [Spirochaetota bacterium]